MNEEMAPVLDWEAFQRVWRRVMPVDRPDCPVVAPPPPPPVPMPPAAPPRPGAAPAAICLGEGSGGGLPALARLMNLTAEGREVYGALDRLARSGGRRAPLAAGLRTAKKGQLARLAAAYFLIAGEDCDLPAFGAAPVAGDFRLGLRERYQAEQRNALAFFTAAQAFADPCLTELCRAIGAENQAHAGRLRTLLEEMQTKNAPA